MISDAGNDVELFGMKRSQAGTELEPFGIGCVRACVVVAVAVGVGGSVRWLVGFTSFGLAASA